MSNAVTTIAPEQVELIKATICKGATNDELKLFLHQCQRTQLDPFSRQIHAVKRWDKRENREVMSIQVGIDGFRLVAQRTGELDGQEGPFWCGEDGQWREVWTGSKPPLAAKVVVYRKNSTKPYTGVAHWNEFKQEFYDKQSQGWKLTPFWQRMPAGQLAKCAEALALRKAFPQELSGLYTPEEMREQEHHEEIATVEVKALPAPEVKQKAANAPTVEAPVKPRTVRERIVAKECVMVGEGLCQAGDLVNALEVTVGDEWETMTPEQLAPAVKEYEQWARGNRTITPQENGELVILLSNKGKTWAALRKSLKINKELAQLNVTEAASLRKTLELLPDKRVA